MSWFHAFRERVAGLFAPRDRDLDEEFAHHLDLETKRQLAAGLDVATARKRAGEKFGDRRRIADATRDARGAPLIDGGIQDVQWAIRSLRRNPGFTALALFTVMFGIGATTAAFAVLDTVVLRDLPYRDASRLVFIQERTAKHDLRPPSHPN